MGRFLAIAILLAPLPAGAVTTVVGGPGVDRGISVARLADGGYIAVGVTGSNPAALEEVFLVRFDEAGGELWQRAFGGPGDDDGWALLETATGFVIGGFASVPERGFDCTLTAVDTEGRQLWSRTYGGAEDDRCWALADTGEGYALVGETASLGEGERDCYLVVTDHDGRQLSGHTFGGAADDRCFSVATAADGLVLAGQTFTFGAGDRDAWIVKTDLDGRLEWSHTEGGAASDVAHSVVAAGDSFLVTGYTTSLAHSPDDPMILKLAGDGSLEWRRVLDLAGHNHAIAGAATRGGFCVTGFSAAGEPLTRGALVIKVDDDGEPLWMTEVLPTARGESFGYGVTTDGDGGCAVVGHTTVGSAGERDLLFALVEARPAALEAPPTVDD